MSDNNSTMDPPDPPAVELALVPLPHILDLIVRGEEGALTSLFPLTELAYVLGPIRPPESASPVSPPLGELALVDIGIGACPSMHSSSIFLIGPELPNVIITIGIVQLGNSLSFAL